MLALDPEALGARCGIAFHIDERRTSTAALLETDVGHQYMLLQHLDASQLGTEALGPDQSSEPERDLNELLAVLGLEDEVVTWRLSRDAALAGKRELGLG